MSFCTIRAETAKNKTFETQRKGGSGGDWVDEPQMNADQGTKFYY